MIDLQPPVPPPETVPDGWEGILQPGEHILWQGQPQPGIDWTGITYGRILFGLVFGGFALFWMVMAFWTAGGTAISYILPLFGLPFLRVGWRMVGEQLWLEQRRLRGTHYTLTDRTAFVATATRGHRQLHRTALTPGLIVSLDDGAPGSVWFAERPDTGPDAQAYSRHNRKRTGFERIAEPRKVWQLIGQNLAALAPPDISP